MQNRMKTLATFFKALGDPKRLLIIKMLASNTEETLCVSDVAARLDISQPAVSQHIKILKSIGLLEENRKGFRVFYKVNTDILGLYKMETDTLFIKAFVKCPHDFSCNECTFNNSCG